MSFLLLLVILITVYVITYKNDFTKEHIEVSATAVLILIVLSLLICVLTNLTRG